MATITREYLDIRVGPFTRTTESTILLITSRSVDYKLTSEIEYLVRRENGEYALAYSVLEPVHTFGTELERRAYFERFLGTTDVDEAIEAFNDWVC